MFAITTSNASTTATADSTPSDMSLEDLEVYIPTCSDAPSAAAHVHSNSMTTTTFAISASFLPPSFLSHKPSLAWRSRLKRFQPSHATREIQSKEEASLRGRDPRLPATAIAQLQEEATESSNLADLQAQAVFQRRQSHVKDNESAPLSYT